MVQSRFYKVMAAVAALLTAFSPRLNAAVKTNDSISITVFEADGSIINDDSVTVVTDTLMGTSTSGILRPVVPRYQMRTPMADLKATPSLYAFPYSRDLKLPQWHRMWVNTAVLSGAFVSTLLVLECLPEDATTWNRAAIQKVPPFTRWFRNVFKRGPEWDHDNPIFNYVLHPYAGAAYFMSARSCGFNFWQSFLYSACISSIGWEFGIEAFMERPSYQDLVITPVVGSVLGELFYKTKRHIVEHNYTLAGSRVLGNIAVFFVDPVNEVIDLFRGNPCRQMHFTTDSDIPVPVNKSTVQSLLMPTMLPGGATGFALTVTF